MSSRHEVYLWLAVIALVLVTVLTRSFFLLPSKEPRLPAWLSRGLRHAPVAALLAMVAPEVMLKDGQMISDWKDPRLFAVAATLSYYFVRRPDVTGAILIGTATLLALRLGAGWV